MKATSSQRADDATRPRRDDSSSNGDSDSAQAQPGPIERQVRRDIDALMSEHPMGEALAAMAFKLASMLDGSVQHMAVAGINRELRETLLELARLGVDDDDDLDAELSRPDVPSEIRNPEEP
ncbi:MAG TPA: hypothetical protein VFH56_01535 [Acidimicrobiales bacterium]|nr:hypothetical protein [Acidimicrobiales bacterium]